MFKITDVLNANLLKLKDEGFYNDEELDIFNNYHQEKFNDNEEFKKNMRAVYEYAIKSFKFWHIYHNVKFTEEVSKQVIALGRELNELGNAIKLTKDPRILNNSYFTLDATNISSQDRLIMSGYTALQELLIDPRSKKYLEKINPDLVYDFKGSSNIVSELMEYTNIEISELNKHPERFKLALAVKEYDLMRQIYEAHGDDGITIYTNIKVEFSSKYGQVLKNLVMILYGKDYIEKYEKNTDKSTVDNLMIDLTDPDNSLVSIGEKAIADILFKYCYYHKPEGLYAAITRDKKALYQLYHQNFSLSQINHKLEEIARVPNRQEPEGHARTRN